MLGWVKDPGDNVFLFFLSRLILVPFLLISVYGGCSNGGGGVIPPPPFDGNKLNIEILDAFIGDDNRPVAMIKLTDENGNPISRDGVEISFIIARIVESGEYIDYITRDQNGATQADSEDEGEYQDLGGGMYNYTFATMLPGDYNRGQTHTVALYGEKTIDSQTWVSNATFDFVPNGGEVRTVRDIVATESCNNCHDPLALHGGVRRDVGVCITCHSSKIITPEGVTVDQIDPDSGNNIGFNIMIHKIHMGEMLPSVEAGNPYFIVGFMGSVHDYSTVVFPQDNRNCTKCHDESLATQAVDYKNDPTRASCGSCHDNVDFATAENHPVVQLNDNNCSGCHIPQSNTEFDISVTGSHTVPLKASSLPGLNFAIVDVRSAETGQARVRPGDHAEVTFSIKTDAGEVVDIADMDSISLVIAGPTTDYFIQDYSGTGVETPGVDNFLRESPESAEGPDAEGNYTYTFEGIIPDNATGTYAVGIEGRIVRMVGGENLILFEEVEEAGRNEVRYFAVTDAVPVPRRVVVDNSTEDEFCNSCHGVFSKDFRVHGNLRNNTEYCVLCHNPSSDDIEVRPVPDWTGSLTPTTASIDFKEMIHKIHTGENLSLKPYIIYGFMGSLHDFSEVLYPGNTSDCRACHLPNTNTLSPGVGVLGNGIQASFFREFEKVGEENVVLATFSTQPVIDACVSCHDNVGVNAAGNALTGENHQAGPQSESDCKNCHGAGLPLGAAEVHLPPLPPAERINRPESE
ncbi:MAG: OmcA/MtrC family decaheme c-type cytochrome [Thermodesulfobacteriota bacterium]